VLGVHNQMFKQDGNFVSGVQYARQNISNWLIEKQLPSDFIYITDGGLVTINPRYIINSYLSRGS
jgi:hypothetical protein